MGVGTPFFVFLLCVGVVFVALGSVVYVEVPKLVRSTIRKTLVVDTPRAALYKSFQNATKSADVYLDYYIYNITNGDDVLAGKDPIVQEVGPYSYLRIQYRPEDSIYWLPNGTVRFKYVTQYRFVPERSVGAETDVVNFVNMGIVGPAYKANLQEIAFMRTFGISELAKSVKAVDGKMILKLTVDEMLWGYENTVLKNLEKTLPLNPVIAMQNPDDPQTYANWSEVYTGAKASPTEPQAPHNGVESYTRWAGYQTYLPYWGNEYANKINGTDGSIFHSDVSKDEKLDCFVDSLYRSVQLAVQKDTSYKGVDLYRFILDRSNLLSERENPDNAAFFMTQQGFIPTPPPFEEPIIISKAHFLDCDPTDVHVHIFPNNGADTELHETMLDVEPHSGTVMRVHKRLQINTRIGPINYTSILNPKDTLYVSGTEDIKETIMPLFWVDENTELPDNLVDDLKKDVLLPLKASKIGGLVAAAVGALLFIGSIAGIVIVKKRRDSYESIQGELVEHSANYDKM